MNHWTILSVCCVVLALSAVLRVDPPAHVYIPGLKRHPLPEICTLRRTAGIVCPGCGMTRSFISAAHGDAAAALRYHPLGPFLFLAVVSQIPYRFWRVMRPADRVSAGGGPANHQRNGLPGYQQWLPWLAGGLLLLTWVLRLLGGTAPV